MNSLYFLLIIICVSCRLHLISGSDEVIPIRVERTKNTRTPLKILSCSDEKKILISCDFSSIDTSGYKLFTVKIEKGNEIIIENDNITGSEIKKKNYTSTVSITPADNGTSITCTLRPIGGNYKASAGFQLYCKLITTTTSTTVTTPTPTTIPTSISTSAVVTHEPKIHEDTSPGPGVLVWVAAGCLLMLMLAAACWIVQTTFKKTKRITFRDSSKMNYEHFTNNSSKNHVTEPVCYENAYQLPTDCREVNDDPNYAVLNVNSDDKEDYVVPYVTREILHKRTMPENNITYAQVVPKSLRKNEESFDKNTLYSKIFRDALSKPPPENANIYAKTIPKSQRKAQNAHTYGNMNERKNTEDLDLCTYAEVSNKGPNVGDLHSYSNVNKVNHKKDNESIQKPYYAGTIYTNESHTSNPASADYSNLSPIKNRLNEIFKKGSVDYVNGNKDNAGERKERSDYVDPDYCEVRK